MRNLNKIIIGDLNVNSLRNKFESLQEQINRNVDVLLILETKPGNSFPNGQFLISDMTEIRKEEACFLKKKIFL